MLRDYEIVSPSLEGVLSHETLEYEGIKRPVEVLRVLDGPSSKGGKAKKSEEDQKILEDYFHDLYGVFMKKLSFFVVESESKSDDNVKLQALLQEMIKIKELIGKSEA